jgi:hypothetical protein
MCVYRKLASVVLVLLIPTVSAVALSACPQMPQIGDVQPQMTMIDMAPVQLNFTASQTNLCCEVSPAEIAEVSLRASVGSKANVIPMTVIPTIQVSRGMRESEYPHAQAPSPPAQARLCVFLI